MFVVSWFLAILAIALAWPVPIILSRAAWTRKSPFTALVLWQSIALAGGLSMIGALLSFGLIPFGDSLFEGISKAFSAFRNNLTFESLSLWHIFALSAAILLFAHLVFTLLLTYARIQRQRTRHRNLLSVLASPQGIFDDCLDSTQQSTDSTKQAWVIFDHNPVAYCLPGGARSVTVLSDGLLKLLSASELKAVLIHEKAHLNQRHHLLLWAFAAWKSALPWLPTSQLAQSSVNSLLEMMADDVALKSVDRPTLIKAIVLVTSGSSKSDVRKLLTSALEQGLPAFEFGSARLSRLIEPQIPLNSLKKTIVLLGSLLLLLLPILLLFLPSMSA